GLCLPADRQGAGAIDAGAALYPHGDPACGLHRQGHSAEGRRRALRQGALEMSHDLFEAARAAMAHAYAPYSKFPVGAAIRAEDGKIYAGANIENISFPQGWCAEPTAISHMIMAGATKIVEMAVIAEKLPLCPPCGGCRQKIAEFASAK